ncbi:MAG: hypothetical protein IJV14_17780 [Lachnospiraceae bacterium]|nr:hypothetical protein [Lachnospiraceae bacterium]
MFRFTEEDLEFLEKELKKNREELEVLDEDGLLEIQDLLFDIELEGDLSDSKTLPKRCRIASDLISRIEESL